MTATRDLVDYLDALLETSAIPDYGNALNGLQLDNSGNVTKVAAAFLHLASERAAYVRGSMPSVRG